MGDGQTYAWSDGDGAAGGNDRPQDFDGVTRILGPEGRLILPVFKVECCRRWGAMWMSLSNMAFTFMFLFFLGFVFDGIQF